MPRRIAHRAAAGFAAGDRVRLCSRACVVTAGYDGEQDALRPVEVGQVTKRQDGHPVVQGPRGKASVYNAKDFEAVEVATVRKPAGRGRTVAREVQ